MNRDDKERSCLVLGGQTGMLGQALTEACRARGWRVKTLGRTDGPILEPDFLEEQIAGFNPDLLFNTIAYTQVDQAEDEPERAYLLNKSFPALLGRVLRGSDCALVHYSTDFVYNGKKRDPYLETDSTDPQSVYGASKLAGENALRELDLPKLLILRTAWLFGPGRRNFVSVILNKAVDRNQLTVVHDQVGSPTYTLDLAEMSLALVDKQATGLVHAVNSGQASWCELASEAVSLNNGLTNVEPICSGQWPQKAKRPEYSVLSTDLLTELTGYRPRPWPQALRDYIFKLEDPA